MNQNDRKWGPKYVKNRSKNASKINRKNSSENEGFQEGRGIPADEQRAEPNSGAGILGPPNYPKST